MKKSEITNELIKHFSKTISCKNCFIKGECGYNFQSQKDCERKMKVAFVKSEK